MNDVVGRVASQFPTPLLRGYARGKLRHDPVYRAVLERLRDQPAPLLDIGCGVGILEIFLRESGLQQPIVGFDHDAGKVAVARALALRYDDIELRIGDIRDEIPSGMNVTALDVLHYFSDEEQSRIVERIAEAVPEGGMAIVRDAVRDGSLRYRLTAVQEALSRAIRWLKAERLNFPTRERIVTPFLQRGYAAEIVPMSGHTPFNNYLFVFRRPRSGTTNA